ncbi:DUF2914 domain-containing protein [Thermodesulforhabdus norvegica]|uniref:DUF2914 domain-containing protein n=1 Tax=Thermodesulforhabdus norvegica TaxID=39841 RepID=A0A1I4QQU3_9BACT|nr:DUF2914 domain-containing protein [Thermodesulforhabdus norvegica]SFM42444.1 Protein of unknown function [Thermodesulforhabdus norvegica]
MVWGKTLNLLTVAIMALVITLINAVRLSAQDGTMPNTRPQLVEALMCEGVKDYACVGPSIVFSVEKREVFCYTRFENVSGALTVYHRWRHRDELSTQIRLRVRKTNPVAYSSIQLREADKGPWQVEVVGEDGFVYEVLRFSITD